MTQDHKEAERKWVRRSSADSLARQVDVVVDLRDRDRTLQSLQRWPGSMDTAGIESKEIAASQEIARSAALMLDGGDPTGFRIEMHRLRALFARIAEE
jgi:hypothetical protein